MSVGKSISEAAADRMEKGETRSSLTNITNFVYTRQTAESGGGGGAEFIHLKHEMDGMMAAFSLFVVLSTFLANSLLDLLNYTSSLEDFSCL